MAKRYCFKTFGDAKTAEKWLNEHENEIENFKIAMNYSCVLIVVEWKAV